MFVCVCARVHTRAHACTPDQACLTLLTPWTVAHQAPLSMEFSRQEYFLPNPGMEPRSPAFQADSLSSETPGNPKNTGVGSLSLLQRLFPTQELNQGLLHCRQILYQLSYQGSPKTYYRASVINTVWYWSGGPTYRLIECNTEPINEPS